jgi:hypothetical protein
LLRECLGPAARALWDQGALNRLWFHRFDARGPHVMVLLGTPAARADAVRRDLSARLDAYLAESPSDVAMKAAELEERHAACRGNRLCSVDALEGFAANDTFVFGDEPADGYLFGAAKEFSEPGEMERLLGELALHAVARAGPGSAAAAIGWTAALDVALRRAGADAPGFWRYYAATLLPALHERIESGDVDAAVALRGRIGPTNEATFARAWVAARDDASAWPGVERIADALVDGGGAEPRRWRGLAREICHGVFAQLGVPVKLRLPLVLYGWLPELPATAPARP